jgi:hypothetical protein
VQKLKPNRPEAKNKRESDGSRRDDLPTTYLLYAVAVILVIDAAAASTRFIIFH